MLSLQLSKIVGTSTEKDWSQVHTFIPAESEKISQRGQLLAVISLEELEKEVETVAAGREIIARLHEEYYGHLTSSPFEQLERAVQKVVAEVESEAVVEIAAAAVVGKVLYLAIAGEGRLILRRRGEVATVLSGEGISSGYLEEGDIFLLGTGKIFAVMAERALEAALAAGSPEKAAETIIPLIHAQEENGALAGLIAKVKTKDQATEQPRDQETERPRDYETKESRPKVDPDYIEDSRQSRRDLRRSLDTRDSSRVIGPRSDRRSGSGLSNWLSKISPFLLRIKRKLKKKKIYLVQRTERKGRSQKMLVTVALILLLILGMSVVFGVQQRKRLGQRKEIAALLEEARQKKEEGEALLELNPLKAKELLLAAQSLIEEIDLESESDQAVIEFKQELEALLPQVLREHQVEPKVYFDLELIKEGARGDDLAVSAEQLVILDREKRAVYSLGVSDRKSAILAGGQEIEGASQVAAFLPQVFVLAEKGIIQADKSQSLVIEAEGDWEGVIDFRAFGGNLYLLDKKGIWKYPVIEGGFGNRQVWLKEEVDFSQAVSMAIDGVIWILESDGAISKYIQGRKEAFGIAGLNRPLVKPAAIYTDDEQEKLYILDKARVVVLAKSGEYEAEYSWPARLTGGIEAGIGEVNSLVASEEENKIFLVGGSKVYEIQLR